MSAALPRIPAQMMLLGFAAACLLHADRAPPWCVAAAAAAILWHLLHFTGRLALPGRWARYGLIALLLAGVLMSFGTLNGLAAGVALLMTMGGLKLLEVRGPRDAVVITTVALILVLAAGLDRQDLWRVPLYAGTGWEPSRRWAVQAPAIPGAWRCDLRELPCSPPSLSPSWPSCWCRACRAHFGPCRAASRRRPDCPRR
jgi:hypothetical protein